jgi:arylsulfatase
MLLWQCTLAALAVLASVATAGAAPKPNVLLIVADDLGYSDLGCYGSEIHTPNLDKLAANGVRLTQFYNCARCCPSRACLMTGLYPHQAGIGNMTGDQGQPGYRGHLNDQCVTIPEVLRPAGYRTYISGKWHLGRPPGPIERGFDGGYVMEGGMQSFWDQSKYRRLPADRPKREYPAGKFYSTDAITDHALDFMADARKQEKPFFVYLAYNAPHFPLHAPKEEIAKYAGVYTKGWDKIRDERYDRQILLGLAPPVNRNATFPQIKGWPLSPRSEYSHPFKKESGVNPAWDSIPADRRADLARRMAIFAAMVDRMDQNIGRVVADLRTNGQLDNTLIIFLSDNGACAEWDPWGFDKASGPNNVLHTGADLEAMGGPDSYLSYGSGWANAGNTPFRLYKHYVHEGGISSPFIAHWPDGMKKTGYVNSVTIAHLIDLLPTIADVAGEFEKARPGDIKLGGPTWSLEMRKLPPYLRTEGRSLRPQIEGPTPGWGDLGLGSDLAQKTLYWEHEGNRAVRDRQWKLVGLHGKPWELYDMYADRTELHDLAAKEPEKVKELAAKYDAWAKRCNVLPWPVAKGSGK